MTVRTSEAKDSNASRVYDLLIFSASLCVKEAQIYKESKWWTWDFRVLLITLLHTRFISVEIGTENRESHKKLGIS